MSKRRSLRFWLLPALLFAVLLSGSPLGSSSPALAQTATNGDWTLPQNLSQSGAAAEPLLFMAEEGLAYVLWRDALAGSLFTQGVLENGHYSWLPPTPVAFPFGAARPALVGVGETIYAFWIDAAAQLQSSWVTPAEFAAATAWSAPQPLAERVLAFAAAVGGDGRLHLAYLARQAAAAAPAGIYYQQSAGSAAWSAPVLLYASPYLRALDAGSVALQLAVSPAGSLFLVWDNPLLEQVFFSRSADGGATWDEPLLFDQRAPDDLADAAGPAHPRVYASSDAVVHLLWTAGHGADACRLYHQWSSDNGDDWQPAQPLPLSGCPQTTQLLAAADDVAPLLLFAVLPTQSALLAWNGQQWSLPQFQTGLGAFRHPATYRPLALGCQQTALATADRLLLVGCDAAQSQDIWAASRPLAALAEWFPPPPVWQEPVALSAAARSAPTLAVDEDGLVHLVWSQPENAGAAPAAIHYARWDGANWSLPAPVLRLPGGAESPSLTVDSRGRLLLVAASGSGALYFSQAAAAAAAGNNWSEPLALPQPSAAAMTPVIDAGNDAIYVVYAVPFNEARGIYLVQSPDGGQSWSDPITVFAAAAAGWEGVAWPRLALTGATRDSLHVTWARTKMPSLTAATALYASHSADGGGTFTPAEMVADNPLRWHDLLTDGGQTLHRLWQTADSGREGNRAVLWHQASEDEGMTWQTAQRVSTQSGPAAAAAVPGQAQLLQWTEETLQQWQWQGGQWLPAESLALPAGTAGAGVTAGITPNGTLLALFYGSAAAPDALFFTSRRVSLPTVLPAPRPMTPPTPPPALSPTATPLALPTATLPFPREDGCCSPQPAANSLLPPPTSSASLLLRVALSVIPAGIFVILVLFRGLQKRRER